MKGATAEQTPRGVARSEGNSRLRQLTLAPEFGAIIAAVLIYVAFVLLSLGHGFVSAAGTASWLNTASELGILAVPVGLLMIAGNFDLSIGSMVGAGGIIIGVVYVHYHEPFILAAAVAIAFACIVGLGNGLLVTRTGLPSFIVTLAASLIVLGLNLTMAVNFTGSTVITITSSATVRKVFAGSLGGFDISIVWWSLVLVGAAWLLGETKFGNWIFATGGENQKARRAGVRTAYITIILYICSALGATFVGVLQAIEYNTGDAMNGQGYVFEAPIVVVIGGVLLTGGYGTVIGVGIGTLIYGIVNAGLFYTGWDTNYAEVVIGTLLVVAVLTNDTVRRLALRGVRPKGGQ